LFSENYFEGESDSVESNSSGRRELVVGGVIGAVSGSMVPPPAVAEEEIPPEDLCPECYGSGVVLCNSTSF